MKTTVMSLGGSLIAPNRLDVNFLKKFRKLILDFTKKGNRVIVICGGGSTARFYQEVASKINSQVKNRDLDWIGIASTRVNAELISAIFGDKAFESILFNPNNKIKTTRKIIVGGGWVPGSSSDKVAVLMARSFKAKTIINLSNIAYVYDKDPKKHKDAKPLTHLPWKEMQKLVGSKWVPGAHLPFDPVATSIAARANMKLIVMKGNNLKNLENCLSGKKFKGTVVY